MKAIPSVIQIRILGILSAVLLVLFVCGTWIFPAGKGPGKISSSFLPPQSEARIQSVSLFSPQTDETVILEKSGGGQWQGRQDDVVFPADETVVSNFIEVLSRRRDLYSLSSSPAAWASYGLADDSAFRIQVRDGGGNIGADLYVGNENYTARRLSFRSGRDVSSFQTENDLYPFLKTDAKWWADMRLFPVKDGGFEPDQIQSVSVRTPDGAWAVRRVSSARSSQNPWSTERVSGNVSPPEDADAINTWLSALVSARGADFVSGMPQQTEASSVTVETGSGKTFRLDVLSAETADGTVYFAVPENAPYALGISAWTYSRIFPSS